MPLPHPLPEELIPLVARRLPGLAEPMRLRLLDRLRDGDATVQQPANDLQMWQQNALVAARPSAHAGAVNQEHTE